VEHLGVALVDHVRRGVVDPTLGIEVAPPAAGPAPAHRLVAIGDSLTQGFHHFAIFDTAISWPAIVAHQLGVLDDFRFPTFDGPGGHPLNLERLARQLTGNPIGSGISVWRLLEQVEDWYERGPGSAFPDPSGPANHNLAVWGWDLRDVLSRTADHDRVRIRPPSDDLVGLVSDSHHRAAVTTLHSNRMPSGRALTPLEGARLLGEAPGGTETLGVWIGANNVLGAVVDLRIRMSGDGYDDLEAKRRYTVWTPEHFRSELAFVAGEVRRVPAQHVLWGTVPHVTIPPITRGLGGPLAECGRYFRFYGRPWHDEDSFDEDVDRHLTGFDAWAIDLIIDQYNLAIEAVVADARQDGLDWRIVDLCAVLDRLATRRNVELGAAPPWVTPYPLPPGYEGFDTLFLTTDTDGRLLQGGLFGLDGTHPTTAGYGIVASEWIQVMAGAGVDFSTGPDGPATDFARVLAADTLLSDLPGRLASVLRLLRQLDHQANLLQRLLPDRLPF
jgi:hypothetical protein